MQRRSMEAVVVPRVDDGVARLRSHGGVNGPSWHAVCQLARGGLVPEVHDRNLGGAGTLDKTAHIREEAIALV